MIGTAGASLGKWARRVYADDADPALTVEQDGTGIGISVKGDVLPSADNQYDLGSALLAFAEIHVSTMVFGTTVTGNWSPSVDDTYSLGTALLRWSNVFAAKGTYGGTVLAATSHATGIDGVRAVYDDLGTLVTGQTYRGGYFRYNVKSTTPSNPTAEVTGVEGVAASYKNDESLTFRGGYFRTYIDTDTDATSTMRTAVGVEIFARAAYNGGSAVVAEGGTAFIGARIWMAPYYTAGTVNNVNNFWGLWIYGEHATQRNADAAIFISDAGGGFTDAIRITAAGGTDADVNVIKVAVTGTPTIFWDESEDAFAFQAGGINARVIKGIGNLEDYFYAPQINDGYRVFLAHITGGADAAVAWLQGAADPYFGFGASSQFKFYSSGVATFGNFGVGAASTGSGITVGAASTNNDIWNASQGASSAALYIGNAQITAVSDIRAKTAITPTIVNALDVLGKLHVIDFTWDDPTDRNPFGKNSRGRWTGISAQEMVKVVPYIINAEGRDCPDCLAGLPCDKHGMMFVEYDQLVPVLVKAIQELSAEVDRLKAARN